MVTNLWPAPALQTREGVTLDLAVSHACPLFELEFGMLVFVAGGKPENPEKNPWNKTRTNKKHNPQVTLGWNQTQALMASAPTIHAPHKEVIIFVSTIQFYLFKVNTLRLSVAK